MKKINNIIKVLILALFLFIVSTLVIIINGKTYTVKIKNKNVNEISRIDEIEVAIEKDNNVKCIDKEIENSDLKLKFK